MKKRQLKKLCKKAADLICKQTSLDCKFDGENICIDEDDGIHVLWYRCSYEYEEYDSVNTWTYLKEQFYHHFFEYDEVLNLPVHTGPNPTPLNVFRWARSRI